MSALSTAEAALRRAPDDPAVPITISGAEAAALIAELSALRVTGDLLCSVAESLHNRHGMQPPETLRIWWYRLKVRIDAWNGQRDA